MQDLLPYLIRQQFKSVPFNSKQSPGSDITLQPADSLTTGSALIDVISGASKGKAISKRQGLWCNAFVASKDAYCGRADTLQAFGDISRCDLCPALCTAMAIAVGAAHAVGTSNGLLDIVVLRGQSSWACRFSRLH